MHFHEFAMLAHLLLSNKFEAHFKIELLFRTEQNSQVISLDENSFFACYPVGIVAFVMSEWQRSQNADNITFLPDGNGAFTKGMGMLVDKEDLGFGQRSWRYSMIVRDGQVEKMFVEPQEPGDPYGVSDADTMLRYLAPEAVIPSSISVLSRQGCPHCARAKGMLRDAGLEFEVLELNEQFTDRSLRALANATTLPQVFVDGERIGGADALADWLGTQAARAA